MGGDLGVLDGVAWQAVNHRGARARLQRHGWAKCGEGDWASVFGSPSGEWAARVSAFEPSYGWFVERGRPAPPGEGRVRSARLVNCCEEREILEGFGLR